MSYWEVLKLSLNRKSIVLMLFISLLYILFAAYALNYRLFLNTVFGSYPLSYRLSILSSLIWGVYTSMSGLDFYLLLATALLVGVNFVLLFATIINLKASGSKVHFLVGGSSVLSLAAIGCTTCGLTLLSVLGISSAFGLLPFGMTLYFISIGSLVFSIFYMLKKLEAVCKIPAKKKLIPLP